MSSCKRSAAGHAEGPVEMIEVSLAARWVAVDVEGLGGKMPSGSTSSMVSVNGNGLCPADCCS